MSELDTAVLLEGFHVRLRANIAQATTKLPPADVAGILLVLAVSTMGLERDAETTAAWLHDLASEVERLGVESAISRRDGN